MDQTAAGHEEGGDVRRGDYALDWTPVFVTGAARTGTSLVRELLNLHPQCCIVGETGFPSNLWLALSGTESVAAPERWGYGHLIVTDKIRGGTILESRWWHLARLREYVDERRLLRRWMDAIRAEAAPAATAFGEKDTSLAYYWERVIEVLPEARIIITERDRDAAAASLLRQDWFLGDEVMARESYDEVYRRLQGCPAAGRVRLEELEAHPRAVVRELLRAVGLGDTGYPMERAVAQVELRGHPKCS